MWFGGSMVLVRWFGRSNLVAVVKHQFTAGHQFIPERLPIIANRHLRVEWRMLQIHLQRIFFTCNNSSKSNFEQTDSRMVSEMYISESRSLWRFAFAMATA